MKGGTGGQLNKLFQRQKDRPHNRTRPNSWRCSRRGIDTPMVITVSKLLAVVIAIGYFVTAVVVEKPRLSEDIMLLLGLLVPLGLIWFPEIGSSWPRKKTVLGTYEDSFGSRTGPWRNSPAWMVALMGWFFLLGLPIILYFIWR